MKQATVDNLIHQLEVFLRENPGWANAEVLFVANFIFVKKDGDYKTIDCAQEDEDLAKNSA